MEDIPTTETMANGHAYQPAGVYGSGTFSAIYHRAYDWGLPDYQAKAMAAIACEMFGDAANVAENCIQQVKGEFDYGERGRYWCEYYGSLPWIPSLKSWV
ncbi:hypothetical protein [Amycolatopsis pithecellobii]|uniref:Uncharacterized protein n=1 Tax=Amycolatopsis pithecellobii TaxID=664692 RepID=A0A6N7YYK2_9PSEU|nr:hypothetical protein [Amycolatopsis pithecellobii]MTD58167.1 hypothetical protein [Amycolatopsis pithecellobii]